jgi:hypothetical protein
MAAIAIAAPALACPRCRVSAGGLADEAIASDSEIAATQQSPDGALKPFSLTFGVDVTTAYFYRGYLQQDRGLITQPYMSIAADFGDQNGGLSISPYIGWWNSIHEEPIDEPRGGHGRHIHVAKTETKEDQVLVPGDPSNPEPHLETITSEIFYPGNAGSGEGWYEVELSAGGLITWRDWWLDLSYHVHLFPGNTHDAIQEFNSKISYDITGWWDKHPSLQRQFSLRPYAIVARELNDQNGDENTYIELGVGPTWRFRWRNQIVAISTPVFTGLSPDGTYYKPNAGDETFGYLEVALKASITLPVPAKFGHWYLNGSVSYLNLIADSAIADNRGDRNEVIGTIGVGVTF